MKKAIAMISADPILMDSTDALNKINNRFKERMAFLNKQAKDFVDQSSKETKPYWSLIEKRLSELNLLPENYDTEKMNLSFDDEANLIFLDEKDDSDQGFADMLRGLFK